MLVKSLSGKHFLAIYFILLFHRKHESRQGIPPHRYWSYALVYGHNVFWNTWLFLTAIFNMYRRLNLSFLNRIHCLCTTNVWFHPCNIYQWDESELNLENDLNIKSVSWCVGKYMQCLRQWCITHSQNESLIGITF